MNVDEAAWRTAGRLLLLTHLEDIRVGFRARKPLWDMHRRLEAYGYDMTRCECGALRRIVTAEFV